MARKAYQVPHISAINRKRIKLGGKRVALVGATQRKNLDEA